MVPDIQLLCTHVPLSHRDLVPLGKLRSDFHVDFTYKRVLNLEHVVSDADNIKQDISIDVYGRKTAKEAKEKAAENVAANSAAGSSSAKKATKKDDEDDIDALLSM